MKKTAMTFVLACATAMPAMAFQTETTPQIFSNRGECQSTLVQLRNQLRRTAQGAVGTNSGQVNQATKVTTQICQAFTDSNGKQMFRIVPQLPTTGL